MAIVHIGLGKTATTTLQRFVFPELSRLRSHIQYNDSVLMSLITKHHLSQLTTEELRQANELCANNNQFISEENLVNWNPHRWEAAADKNLELFGKNSTIIITVREPLSYMTSVYQQMIHEGNIIPPENFFVSKEDKKIQTSFWTLKQFDVDAFDLQTLYDLYKTRFDKVVIVDIKDLSKLTFIQQVFSLNDNELNHLQNILHVSPRLNLAYSKLAMSLTFIKANILKTFGIKTKGSWDLDLQSHKPGRQIWRKFMQHFINRVFKYKKYQLPTNIYLNTNLIEANRKWLKSLASK
jgi:hypothetical protein